MSKGRKTGGRDWKPGESGNPKGPTPLPLEVREFRKAARAEIIEEFKYLWSMTEQELRDIINPENDVPMIRKAIARQLLGGELEEVLNRVIGKPKEEIDLNHNGSIHGRIVALMSRIEKKNGEEARHVDENKKIGEAQEDEKDDHEET